MTIENQRRMSRLSTHLKAMEASESSLPEESDLISLQFDEQRTIARTFCILRFCPATSHGISPVPAGAWIGTKG